MEPDGQDEGVRKSPTVKSGAKRALTCSKHILILHSNQTELDHILRYYYLLETTQMVYTLLDNPNIIQNKNKPARHASKIYHREHRWAVQTAFSQPSQKCCSDGKSISPNPCMHTDNITRRLLLRSQVYVLPVDAGMGQSSSVMLDQKTQIMMTAARVKRVSKKPPLIAPFEPLQMCTLMTYWKIWPMAKRSMAAVR